MGREASQLIKTSESLIRRVLATFVYGLKDISKLDEFNQVTDWRNSSFSKQALRTQIKPDILTPYSDFRLENQSRNSSNAL